jgi:hypothetical protein
MQGDKDAIREYLATIGSRGGSAATGAKKRRPKAHYQRMAKLSHAKRKAKRKGKSDERSDQP